MKMKTRSAAWLLTLAMLLPGFTACGETAENTDAPAAAETVPSADPVSAGEERTGTASEAGFDPWEGLPAADYEGHVFTMLIRPDERWIDDMYAEEINGDPVNDAVFERNAAIADHFDIAIAMQESSDYNYDTDAIASIQAGEDAYDLIVPHGRAAFAYANQQLCLNWNTDLTYITLDSPWWNQDARKSFSIAGKLFVMNGDLSYNSLGSANVMLFNKALMTDLGMDYPYDTVLEGGWTYDFWKAEVLNASSDLNGDGVIDRKADLLGYVTRKWIGPMQAFATSGLRVLSKDENDLPYLSFYSEKTVDVYERYFALLASDDAYVELEQEVDTASGYIMIFAEDRALFIDMNMTSVTTLRTMDTDFGVVPWPKYDESADYCTNVDAGTNVFIVPVTAQDPERTSSIIEAMAKIGSQTVFPAFYETTLQGKVSRDSDSAGMLDIIKQAMIFDLGYYNEDMSGVFSNEFVNLIEGDNPNLTSWYEKNSKAVGKILERVLKRYTEG